jgi:hypothetical protein
VPHEGGCSVHEKVIVLRMLTKALMANESLVKKTENGIKLSFHVWLAFRLEEDKAK